MLTQAQRDAIREHVALDEPIRRLISLATTDLYHGPLIVEHEHDEPDADAYPGFVAACRMIGEAMPRGDLFIDRDIDEVIGDSVEHWHGCECGCSEEESVVGYYPETVIHVDNRDVVRTLVGTALAEYV